MPLACLSRMRSKLLNTVRYENVPEWSMMSISGTVMSEQVAGKFARWAKISSRLISIGKLGSRFFKG